MQMLLMQMLMLLQMLAQVLMLVVMLLLRLIPEVWSDAPDVQPSVTSVNADRSEEAVGLYRRAGLWAVPSIGPGAAGDWLDARTHHAHASTSVVIWQVMVCPRNVICACQSA